MTPLEQRIADWHKRKFGIGIDEAATFKKLCEEVGELGEAMMRGWSPSMAEEIGDVAMVLCHLARRYCKDGSLENALDEALAKCEDRLINGREE